METYHPDTYGEKIAGVYDDWYTGCDEAALDVLAGLAGGGRALELGIGTGRVALPLQARGVQVHGIDVSPAMVERLRSKPGGERLPVTLGNFAALPVEGEFELIYVMFNTFYGLLTQEDQVRCFQNAARHLSPEGVFVIEAFVPDVARFSGGQNLRTVNVGEGEVRLDATRHDPLSQHITSQHIVLTEQGVRMYPVHLRYAWPPELDLMARLAGLQLRSRWANWQQEAFSAASRMHISVYAAAPA